MFHNTKCCISETTSRYLYKVFFSTLPQSLSALILQISRNFINLCKIGKDWNRQYCMITASDQQPCKTFANALHIFIKDDCQLTTTFLNCCKWFDQNQLNGMFKMKHNNKMCTQRKEHLNFRGKFHQTTFISHSLSNTQIPFVTTCYYKTRNAFCGTWYLSHSLIHNEQTVPIIIARSITHARNSHISTSGLKSDVIVMFLGPDFL